MKRTSPEVRAPDPVRQRLPGALAAELERGRWDYPWSLAPGLVAPAADPGARHAAATLDAMLGPSARDALLDAEGRQASALVLNCGEARLCHRLLEWGAARVLGLDDDRARLWRARLVRDHFGVPAAALELRDAEHLESLAAAELGRFDVVVLAGNVEPVELSPALIELARGCTRRLFAVAGVLTDREAAVGALRGAGFGAVSPSPAPADAERRFIVGSHGVLLAWPEAQDGR